MATAELPIGLRQTEFREKERQAAMLFHELATQRVPGVGLRSRRTRAGYLKMVVEYPEGCALLAAVDTLVEVSN